MLKIADLDKLYFKIQISFEIASNSKYLIFRSSTFQTVKKVKDKFHEGEIGQKQRAWKILKRCPCEREFSKYEGSYFAQKPWFYELLEAKKAPSAGAHSRL